LGFFGRMFHVKAGASPCTLARKKVSRETLVVGDICLGFIRLFSKMFHVKRSGGAQIARALRSRRLLIWTARIEIAAGVIPGIRAACPSDRGRTADRRSETSVERPITPLKIHPLRYRGVLEPRKTLDRIRLP